MTTTISYFQLLLHTAVSQYFGQESEYASIYEIPQPESKWLGSMFDGQPVTFEEQTVLLLALMPHICPEALDLFFIRNKNLDRPYTEFGGWTGTSHGGFLPTGETAAFILSVNNQAGRQQALDVLSPQHRLCKQNIMYLERAAQGEPFLSGRLTLSEEFLSEVIFNAPYHSEYSSDFPARQITTELDWDDLVLPYYLHEELDIVRTWFRHEHEIRAQWNLGRYMKQGYRCVFYGPSGTGKTLTATLIGKQHGLDVYRVDLSMIVSKYIGETEKNLAKVFNKAEQHDWILFFDEADALFGKRVQSNTSNDRYANQEVAYLLQRIEDFPGKVILATNMKDSMDDAFTRRFQSVLYFPLPDENLRRQLWEKILPKQWLKKESDLPVQAAVYPLSGGSIVNVVQNCAIALFRSSLPYLTKELLMQTINKELAKEGKMINMRT